MGGIAGTIGKGLAGAVGGAVNALGGGAGIGSLLGGAGQLTAGLGALRQQDHAMNVGVFDPTNPATRALGGQQAQFLQQLFNGGQSPFAGMQSGLQQQASGQLGNLLGYNPEGQAFGQAQNALAGLLAGRGQFSAGNPFAQAGTQAYSVGANPFGSAVPQGVQAQGAGGFQQALSTQQARAGGIPGGLTQPNLQMQQVAAGNQSNFAGRVQASGTPFAQQMQTGAFNPGANPFARQQGVQLAGVGANPYAQQAQNPFALQGFINPAQTAINAALPVFDRNLRQANAQHASAAPGRFSSAFVDQGNDLNAQALNDFNLFAGQQLMQGEQLRAQQQAQAQQFLLGARGLAQDAFGQSQGLGLQAAQQNNAASLQARGLAQQAFGDQQNLGLQAFTQGQGQALQARELAQNAFEGAAGRDLAAQQTNAQTRLGELGLNQQALESFNSSSLQARQLFQQGQLDLRGLEQQLATQLQALGIDATRANNEAALQARQLAQEAQTQGADRNLQAQLANQQSQLQARQLEQQLFTQLQSLGLDANTAAQQAALQARGMAQDAFFQQQGLNFQGQQLAQQGQLDAAGMLGQLAQMAGAGQFDRTLGAGQFGLEQSMAQINPLLALMQSGLQFGQPADLQAVGYEGTFNPSVMNAGGFGAPSAGASASGFPIFNNPTTKPGFAGAGGFPAIPPTFGGFPQQPLSGFMDPRLANGTRFF
jgi:hypothetical protein